MKRVTLVGGQEARVRPILGVEMPMVEPGFHPGGSTTVLYVDPADTCWIGRDGQESPVGLDFRRKHVTSSRLEARCQLLACPVEEFADQVMDALRGIVAGCARRLVGLGKVAGHEPVAEFYALGLAVSVTVWPAVPGVTVPRGADEWGDPL